MPTKRSETPVLRFDEIERYMSRSKSIPPGQKTRHALPTPCTSFIEGLPTTQEKEYHPTCDSFVGGLDELP